MRTEHAHTPAGDRFYAEIVQEVQVVAYVALGV